MPRPSYLHRIAGAARPVAAAILTPPGLLFRPAPPSPDIARSRVERARPEIISPRFVSAQAAENPAPRAAHVFHSTSSAASVGVAMPGEQGSASEPRSPEALDAGAAAPAEGSVAAGYPAAATEQAPASQASSPRGGKDSVEPSASARDRVQSASRELAAPSPVRAESPDRQLAENSAAASFSVPRPREGSVTEPPGVRTPATPASVEQSQSNRSEILRPPSAARAAEPGFGQDAPDLSRSPIPPGLRQPATSPAPAESGQGLAEVRIGSLEVRIIAPPQDESARAAAVASAPQPARSAGPLSRGFASFGLVQS